MVFEKLCKSILLVILFVVNSGCGRKYRNIFFFNPDTSIKLETLDFPAVKGIHACGAEQGVTISWLPVTNCGQGTMLVGYNIYRLTQEGFIQRKPLNRVPIQETMYTDECGEKLLSYVVRAVFKVQNKIKEGPTSLVVSLKRADSKRAL